jgi:cell division GTPase FtsZ
MQKGKAVEAGSDSPEDDLSCPGWHKVENIIVYIYGSDDLPLCEVAEAGDYIRERIAKNAEIITGTIHKSDIQGIRIFIFGTTGSNKEVSSYDNTLNISYSNASSKNIGSKHTLHETPNEYAESSSLWDRIIGKNVNNKKKGNIFGDDGSR